MPSLVNVSFASGLGIEQTEPEGESEIEPELRGT
jgi:hypothetical protein